MPLTTQQITIVGAGIGGLTAALELSALGASVTVLEAAAGPGGKMRTLPSEAGPVDAGPTVFTMRHVFDELFATVGETLEDHLTLHPLERLARHHWRGSGTLDLYADPARSRDAIGAFAGARAAREFDAFSARARRLFTTLEGPVMRAADPTPLSVAAATWRHAPQVLRDMAPTRSLARLLRSSFTDPRLRQLFGRYATYVGGSPYASPAILSLIWHAEASGVFQVEGGMGAVAQKLEALCKARGVVFRYGTPVDMVLVSSGRVTGVALQGGAQLQTETVVFNGDPAALGSGLVGEAARAAAAPRLRGQRSLSAWVWTFAADPGGADLTHHNVMFGDDYPSEFHDLFRLGRVPQDPTLYICAQAGVSGRAMRGPERFQVLMNAPANGDVTAPSEKEIRQCEKTVFQRLAEGGLSLSPPTAENALTTPWDLDRLFPGSGGALYGTNPHSLMTTFRRPRARSRVEGLYLAGGAVHPGPGVPMAALSGRLAVAAILEDRASTLRSRRTGTPGGMSTVSRRTAGAVSRSSVS